MKKNQVIQAVGILFGLSLLYKLAKQFHLIDNPVETIGQEEPVWIVDGVGTAPKYNDNRQTCHGGWCYSLKNYDEIASNLYNAGSIFTAGNGYPYVIQQFKKCKTIGDVHGVVVTFSKKYDKDLYQYLMNFGGLFPWDGLTNNEMEKLNNFINTLPIKL
jgi:hypothetical protein